MVLALEEIAVSIDVSVQAWEKRDYWVKADRFRMEWEWAGALGPRGGLHVRVIAPPEVRVQNLMRHMVNGRIVEVRTAANGSVCVTGRSCWRGPSSAWKTRNG